LILSVASFTREVTPKADVKLSYPQSNLPISDSRIISQTPNQFDPFKHLPAGAKISDRNKHVVFADVDGDGKEEVVIFYTLLNGDERKANILVLESTGKDYFRFWENVYDGAGDFEDPTGVYDLNKSGRPQIVAYRTIGASCPGVLDIYQYQNSTIERISGHRTDTCQSNLEIRDLNGDGIPEIIFRIRNYGINPDIYRWNGKRYVHSNNLFPEYYNSELEKLVKAVYSREYLPASARLMWANQIVQIYIIQKRYNEAIQLSKEMPGIIDDASLTQPDLIEAEAQSRVYRLRADTYKAAGDLRRARSNYNMAHRLEAEAKERKLMQYRKD
jgi:hypothetical protein